PVRTALASRSLHVALPIRGRSRWLISTAGAMLVRVSWLSTPGAGPYAYHGADRSTDCSIYRRPGPHGLRGARSTCRAAEGPPIPPLLGSGGRTRRGRGRRRGDRPGSTRSWAGGGGGAVLRRHPGAGRGTGIELRRPHRAGCAVRRGGRVPAPGRDRRWLGRVGGGRGRRIARRRNLGTG